MEYKEDDYLMISGIQHFAFCRRQWALIHIEQQWAENYRTTAGALMHKRAHEDDLFELRGNILTAHNLRVSSRQLGVTGQCDIIEFHKVKDGITLRNYEGKWNIVPVEYKHGEPKEGTEDEMQLCLQAMCLEEQFLTEIQEGYLFYGEKRRRTKVKFTEQLRNDVKRALLEMHQLMEKGFTPKVKQSKKCKACSLRDLCLPKLSKNQNVSLYLKSKIFEDGDS